MLEQKRGGWRGRRHAQNWWRSRERYALRIGRRPVSEVNTADVLEALTPIMRVSTPSVGRCQRIEEIQSNSLAEDVTL